MRKYTKIHEGPLLKIAILIAAITISRWLVKWLASKGLIQIDWLFKSGIELNSIILIIYNCVFLFYHSSVQRAWISLKLLLRPNGKIKVSFRDVIQQKTHDTFVILNVYFSTSLLVFFQLFQKNSDEFLKLVEGLTNLVSGLCLFTAYLILHFAPIHQQLNKVFVKFMKLIPPAAILIINIGLSNTSLFSVGQIEQIDLILKVTTSIINFSAMFLLGMKYELLGDQHIHMFNARYKKVWAVSMILFYIYGFAQLVYVAYDFLPSEQQPEVLQFILIVLVLGKIGFLVSTHILMSKGIIYNQFNGKMAK